MSAGQIVRLLPVVLFVTACLPANVTGTPPESPQTPATRTPRPPITSRPIQLPPDTAAALSQLEEQVQTLRGLQPAGAIARSLVSSQSLEARIGAGIEQAQSAPDAEDQSNWLQLLGLAPASFDWRAFRTEIATEQPMSYYDEAAAELVVVADQALTPVVRLNYVHEYANALVANVFDATDSLGLSEAACAEQRDRCQAARALLEGDASLVEEQWMRVYASNDELAELIGFYQAFESPAFTAAPAAIQAALLFPFQHGLEFVRAMHIGGGWAAVDALYRTPPTSTEMILHPHAYPEDTPRALQDPAVANGDVGSGWRQIAAGTVGEHSLQLILSQQLPQAAAEQAAQGWYGDYFIAFHHDSTGAGAWAIVHIWDTIRDSQQAFLAWRDYGDQRLGEHSPDGDRYLWHADDGAAVLERASNQTLWLMAPDETIADRLRLAISFPLGLE